MFLCNILALLVVAGVTSALFYPPCSRIGCRLRDNPVCASNGVTYANPCDLSAAACMDRSITGVHRGACTTGKKCLQACYEIYAPVCGSDGKTYSNDCYLNIATCQSNGRVKMVSKRRCESSTKRPTARPSLGSSTRFAVNYKKNCPSVCFALWAPVCGSDGRTYSNSCTLGVANCESDGKVKMAYKGACGRSSSKRPTSRPVRGSTTPKVKKTCGQICPALWAPVCGSDGKTYSNTCVFNIAKCESNGRITMVSRRPCESSTKRPTERPSLGSSTRFAVNYKKNCPSVCFALWSPVCGSDGRTYSNSCTLGVANCESDGKVKMAYKGVCGRSSSKRPTSRPVRGSTTPTVKKTCGQFCAALWAPVCGSDGKTYSNTCSLNIANCKSNGKITMVAKRPC